MCIVCVLWNKEKITAKEGMKALWEQIRDAKNPEEEQHIREIYAKLEEEDANEIQM